MVAAPSFRRRCVTLPFRALFALRSVFVFVQGLLNNPDMLRNIMFSNPQMQQVRSEE